MSYMFFEKSDIALPNYKIGTKLKCLDTVKFMDGSIHNAGTIYIVDESTMAYFSVCYKNYIAIGDDNESNIC